MSKFVKSATVEKKIDEEKFEPYASVVTKLHINLEQLQDALTLGSTARLEQDLGHEILTNINLGLSAWPR